MRALATAVLVTLLLVTATLSAAADTTTAYANADAFTYSGNTTTNYGSMQWLAVGQQNLTGTTRYRSLLSFDTSGAVPAGATVTSAILYLQTQSWFVFTGDPAVVAVYDVDGSWSESGVTWATQPTLGSQVGTDTLTVTGSDPGTVSFNVTSGWAESTVLDFYLAATNPSTAQSLFQPYSRQATGTSNDPYLEITYENGEQVPEPCTLALVGLGLGGLILKRRRGSA